MSILFKPNGSLNIAIEPTDLPDSGVNGNIVSEALTKAKNVRYSYGRVRTRYGTRLLRGWITSLTEFGGGSANNIPIYLIVSQESSGTKLDYVFANHLIYIMSSDLPPIPVRLAANLTNAQWYGICYNAIGITDFECFTTNGTEKIRASGESNEIRTWGIDALTDTPFAEIGSKGTLTGVYKFRATIQRKTNLVLEYESNPGPESNKVTLNANTFKGSFDPPSEFELYENSVVNGVHYADYELGKKITGFGIYRTLPDGESYYKDFDYELKLANARDSSNTEINNTIDYGYFHEWERRDGYISGTGLYMGLWSKFDYSYTYDWEPGELTNIGESFGTGKKMTIGQNAFAMDSCFDWEADDSSNEMFGWVFTADWEEKPLYMFSWEAHYIANTNSATASDGRSSRSQYWEPISFESNTTNASLGALLETDHDRPPNNINFLLGPTFDGTVLAIAGKNMYFSKPKQPEYWPSNYFIEVSTEQDPGIALASWNGQVYFITGDEIYFIQGSGFGNFFPIRMRARTGAIGHRGVLSVAGHGIFHVSNDGIYLWSGSDQKISHHVLDPIFGGEDRKGIPFASTLSNCWLLLYKNEIFFAYTSTGHTYPSNIIVMNLTDKRIRYLQYTDSAGIILEFSTAIFDSIRDAIIAGSSSGRLYQLEDKNKNTDDGFAIAWEIRSKDFTLQTRKHFPRWAKYDTEGSMTGKIYLDDTLIHEHSITKKRETKRRLIEPDNGDRFAIELSGSGPATVYAVEAE